MRPQQKFDIGSRDARYVRLFEEKLVSDEKGVLRCDVKDPVNWEQKMRNYLTGRVPDCKKFLEWCRRRLFS